MLGETISHYRIVSKLGQGGMGEVYLAEDIRLGRKVALKFLAPELARDRESFVRFRNEAKAAAELSHPNIATIHDIGEADGRPFLVLEYLAGQTLGERIAQGPLPIEDVQRIGQALAVGLAEAHSHGVVHRDIKSANVMLTEKGEVKILDFGLAHRGDATQITRPGTTLGTISYMSPEQAKGERADARSDIWSLGVVLYECVTGKLPFGGQSAAVIEQILATEPRPPTELRSLVPMELEQSILRCLRKDPQLRYQHATDLLAQLKGIEISSTVTTRPRKIRDSRRWFSAVAIAVIVGVAALSIRFLRPNANGEVRFRNPIQITTHIEPERYPSFSPDGRSVAYASRQDGDWDIWVRRLGDIAAVNRTEDHSGWDTEPAWSPDGDHIAFSSERDGGGIFVMPSIGGVARKIAGFSSTADQVTRGVFGGDPRWSVDSSRIAFIKGSDETSTATIITLETLESQTILLPGQWSYRWGLSWSPDGRFLVYVDANGAASDTKQIRVLRISDGETFEVTDRLTDNWSPRWSSSGDAITYTSNREGSRDLWRQGISSDGKPSGAPLRLTTGVGMREAEFAADGSKLVYSVERPQYNLFRVPVFPDRPANWADAKQLSFEQQYLEYVDLSPDGSVVAFNATRAGSHDLYLMSLDGKDAQRLTATSEDDWWPRWSPNGKEIAFYSYRSGNRDIWVIPLDDRVARRLTTHEAMDLAPSWSPNGRTLAFNSNRSGNHDIWLAPLDSGAPLQLTKHVAWDAYPEWSHDGEWVLFLSERSGERCLWRVPASGGNAEQLTTGSVDLYRPAPDGERIFFKRSGNLWSLSLADRTEQLVADFDEKLGGNNFGFSIDGDGLIFVGGGDLSDLWIMDVAID